MEKETVLEIEFQPVFDKWAWRVVKQNEEVLKRGVFDDIHIGVYSTNIPSYNYYNCTLEDNEYYYIDSEFSIRSDNDNYVIPDNNKYMNGNYFRTKEQAEEYAEYMRQKSLEWHEKRE